MTLPERMKKEAKGKERKRERVGKKGGQIKDSNIELENANK